MVKKRLRHEGGQIMLTSSRKLSSGGLGSGITEMSIKVCINKKRSDILILNKEEDGRLSDAKRTVRRFLFVFTPEVSTAIP